MIEMEQSIFIDGHQKLLLQIMKRSRDCVLGNEQKIIADKGNMS